MQELMVDYISSLDGFGSADGWPGLWGDGWPGVPGVAGRGEHPAVRRAPRRHDLSDVRRLRRFRGGGLSRRPHRPTETRVLPDPAGAPALGQQHPGRARRRHRGPGVEAVQHRAAAHDREPEPVRVAAEGRSGRSVPGRGVPGGQRRHRARPDLRRVARRTPGTGAIAHAGRPTAAVRVHSHCPRRATRAS